jgi:hypothetical protein
VVQIGARFQRGKEGSIAEPRAVHVLGWPMPLAAPVKKATRFSRSLVTASPR